MYHHWQSLHPSVGFGASQVDVNFGQKYNDHADEQNLLPGLGDRFLLHLKCGRSGTELPFPVKLHHMLEYADVNNLTSIVSWQSHGRCFVVHKQKEFVDVVMNQCFRQTKFPSFQRQLNLYGFRRITTGRDKGGYYHECFLRGKRFLCYQIHRIKIKGTKVRQASAPNTEPNFYGMPFLPEIAGTGDDGSTICKENTAVAVFSSSSSFNKTMPTSPAKLGTMNPSSFPSSSPSLSPPQPLEMPSRLEASKVDIVPLLPLPAVQRDNTRGGGVVVVANVVDTANNNNNNNGIITTTRPRDATGVVAAAAEICNTSRLHNHEGHHHHIEPRSFSAPNNNNMVSSVPSGVASVFQTHNQVVLGDTIKPLRSRDDRTVFFDPYTADPNKTDIAAVGEVPFTTHTVNYNEVPKTMTTTATTDTSIAPGQSSPSWFSQQQQKRAQQQPPQINVYANEDFDSFDDMFDSLMQVPPPTVASPLPYPSPLLAPQTRFPL